MVNGFSMVKQFRRMRMWILALTTVMASIVMAAPNSESAQKLDTLVQQLQTDGQSQALNSDEVVQSLQTFTRDSERAIRARAQLWLGRVYRDGLGGTGKDLTQAFHYFEQAAGREGLNSEAQFELGRAYMNGEGTDRNLIAAYMWTELSLHQVNRLLAEAEIQKQKLESLLNQQQREKANELVSQLEELYLK